MTVMEDPCFHHLMMKVLMMNVLYELQVYKSGENNLIIILIIYIKNYIYFKYITFLNLFISFILLKIIILPFQKHQFHIKIIIKTKFNYLRYEA